MKSTIKKGIILAGGHGTRLYPATSVVCKQLLPLYDKPMIYYPLSTLLLFGITDILIISTPADTPRFRDLLGDGSGLGISLEYIEQPSPGGIGQAFIIGEKFIGKDPVALILGDNVFYGAFDFLRDARSFSSGATVFGYYVSDPERYGVIAFDKEGKVTSIEEKPAIPKSHYAVTGFYLYDNQVVSIAKGLRPSERGEIEITDINRAYLENGLLKVVHLGRGIAWLDTGTHESLLDAGNFIGTVEKRQGQKIGCIEEVAFRMGHIDRRQFDCLISAMAQNDYRSYLESVREEIGGKHS